MNESEQHKADAASKAQFNASLESTGGAVGEKYAFAYLKLLEKRYENTRIGKQFFGVKGLFGLGIVSYFAGLPFYLHLSFLYYCFFAAIICFALPVLPHVKHLPPLREVIKVMPLSLATLIGSIVLGAAILSGVTEIFCALIFIIAAIAATRNDRFKRVAEEAGAITYFYVFLGMIIVSFVVGIYAEHQATVAFMDQRNSIGMGTTGNFIAVAFLYTVLVAVMCAATYVAFAKIVYVEVAKGVGTYMECNNVKSTRKNIDFAMKENGPFVHHYMTVLCEEKGISVDFVRGTGRGNGLMTLFNIVGGLAFCFVGAPFLFNSGALAITSFSKNVADHREGEEAFTNMNEEPSGMNDVKKV